jgi:hypothetical protein
VWGRTNYESLKGLADQLNRLYALDRGARGQEQQQPAAPGLKKIPSLLNTCVCWVPHFPTAIGCVIAFIWRWPFTSLVLLWTNKVYFLPYSVQPAAAVCAPGAEEDAVIVEDMYSYTRFVPVVSGFH